MPKFVLGMLFCLLSLVAQANLPPLTQDPTTGGSSNNAANPAAALINTSPPAVQQYQSVDEPAPAAVSSAVAATPTTSVPVTKKVSPVATTSNKQLQKQQGQLSSQVQDLESRLTQFTQSYLLAQQESKQELALLEQKTTALQAEIEQLMTVLKAMNQQVDQLNAKSSSFEQRLAQFGGNAFIQNYLVKLKSLLADMNNTIWLLIVLAVLAIWLLVRRHKRKVALKMAASMPVTEHAEDDTKNEYDFMGSSEGVPAQLDLARAYIAMENYPSAEAVLNQVLAKGDDAQQQQARELLNKIVKK